MINEFLQVLFTFQYEKINTQMLAVVFNIAFIYIPI